MAKEKQTRRMIAMALAAAVAMSSVPVVAFAEDGGSTPVAASEGDGNSQGDNDNTDNTDSGDSSDNSSTTVNADGSVTKTETNTVSNADGSTETTEVSTTTSGDANAETGETGDNGSIEIKAEVTVRDADGNVVNEYTVVEGESTTTEPDTLDDGNEPGQTPVEVPVVPGETTEGTASTTTTTGDTPDGADDPNYDYTETTETDRTVTVETSEVEVTVNDSDKGIDGENKEDASGLTGLPPVYDEDEDPDKKFTNKADDLSGGKDGLFDRNFLSSHTLDYVEINGVSIWVDKGTKTIVDVVTPEGAVLPEHDMLKDVTVGANVSHWYPKSNSFATKSFPEGTVYKGGTKTNVIENWYDEEGNLLVTEEGDFRYVGTGEHSKYFAGLVKVIYKKDEAGNTVYDEKGNPVIEKLVNNVSGADHTSGGELVDAILPEYEFDSGFSSSRAQNFMLMDKEGNRVFAYCCDAQTGAITGKWYNVSNLEDSDYYTPESEDHIRSIVMNGYWGTSDVQKEDGSYETGSLEGIKEKLLKAIESGEIDRYVQVPVRDTTTDGAGKIQVDENGDPIYHEEKMDLQEIIKGMTEGEALLATQAAIWSFANGSQGATSGIDGPVVVTPDWYRNHQIDYSKIENEPLDDAAGVRVTALYNWLMNLKTEETKDVVINEKNFVDEMNLIVGDKVADHANNQDDYADNDVYNTKVSFSLEFVPGENDDLLVQVKYTDLDGKEQTVTKRLAGENTEGQTYEDIKPEADGSYVISGLQLSENKEFNFDLRLEGTQYLEQGVYVYAPVGGRDVSQTFVGIAEGERNVDVSMGMTISFDVDENDKLTATRKWRTTSSKSYGDGDNDPTPDPEDPNLTPEDPGEETDIPEEDVPLADAPEVEGEEIIVDEDVPLGELVLGDEDVVGDDEMVLGDEELIAATGDSNHMTAGFGGMLAALAGMFMLRRKKEQ